MASLSDTVGVPVNAQRAKKEKVHTPKVNNFPDCLLAQEEDIKMLLVAKAHIGTNNCDSRMKPYIHKRRLDGVYIMDVRKTWEKIVLAARIIAAVDNPKDVCVVSSRQFGQRAVLKFAINTGTEAVAGRFTPGSFTNYITRHYKEPRVVVVADPRADAQAVGESSYVNTPVIAFCNSDSPMKQVDIAIPINNAGKHALGLGFWLLAREVLRLRGTIDRSKPWDIMADMFFYRDPEDLEAENEMIESEKVAEQEGTWNAMQTTDAGFEGADVAGGVASGTWDATDATDWAADVPGKGADWATETPTSGWN